MTASFYSFPDWAFLLLAYVLGAIPFGLLFVKWSGRGDVRDVGSGNIGATNVLRTGSKKLAAATLAADLAKGALAVYLASSYGHSAALPFWAGFIAILGHIFPVWLKFKGGKGVATALGTFICLNGWLALVTALVWGIMAKTFRISSLSALIAFSVAPAVSCFLTGTQSFLTRYCLGIALLILWTHRSNIYRLYHRKEDPLDQ